MGSQTTSEQLDGWTHKVRKVVDQIPSPQLTTKTCKLHPIAIIYLGTVRDCSSSHQNDDCLLLFISQLSSTKIIRHSKHSGKGKGPWSLKGMALVQLSQCTRHLGTMRVFFQGSVENLAATQLDVLLIVHMKDSALTMCRIQSYMPFLFHRNNNDVIMHSW